MKIALLGHGAMGSVVGVLAKSEGHSIGLTLTDADAGRAVENLTELLRGHDVAIDFSVADAVLKHATACVRAHVPLVEGTTGWRSFEDEVLEIVQQEESSMVYGANFSIGMNVFYRMVEHAAKLFRGFDTYAPFIEEAHHSRKRDAPSGTALRLRDLMAPCLNREIPIASTRAGHIPGIHRVGFDGPSDQIQLVHTARSREGFAAGALLAAHWIVGRKGVFQFSEVMDEIIGNKRTVS
jgi:4-hydroxy-tetrahydrodipicolinate reductase